MADDTLRCGMSAFRTDECGCYYLFPHEHDDIKIKCCVKDVTSHLKSVGVTTGDSYWHFSLGESMTEEINLKNLKHPDALIDVEKENMMLVDAGIVINSPYPTILRPSRKVDLILSFDFSERDDDKQSPFGELLQSEKWAKARDVKFPEIATKMKKIEEERGQGQYDEMYIFESEGAPTIMHFVMVNKSFRTTDDFDIFPAYETLKFNYTMAEFDKLHTLVRHNVLTNNDKIFECIEKAISKKQHDRIKESLKKKKRI